MADEASTEFPKQTANCRINPVTMIVTARMLVGLSSMDRPSHKREVRCELSLKLQSKLVLINYVIRHNQEADVKCRKTGGFRGSMTGHSKNKKCRRHVL